MAGDFVMRFGESGDALYIVDHGTLHILDRTHKSVLKTLTDGDYVGENSFLENRSRSASVQCATNCVLYCIDRYSVFNAKLVLISLVRFTHLLV